MVEGLRRSAVVRFPGGSQVGIEDGVRIEGPRRFAPNRKVVYTWRGMESRRKRKLESVAQAEGEELSLARRNSFVRRRWASQRGWISTAGRGRSRAILRRSTLVLRQLRLWDVGFDEEEVWIDQNIVGMRKTRCGVLLEVAAQCLQRSARYDAMTDSRTLMTDTLVGTEGSERIVDCRQETCGSREASYNLAFTCPAHQRHSLQ